MHHRPVHSLCQCGVPCVAQAAGVRDVAQAEILARRFGGCASLARALAMPMMDAVGDVARYRSFSVYGLVRGHYPTRNDSQPRLQPVHMSC